MHLQAIIASAATSLAPPETDTRSSSAEEQMFQHVDFQSREKKKQLTLTLSHSYSLAFIHPSIHPQLPCQRRCSAPHAPPTRDPITARCNFPGNSPGGAHPKPGGPAECRATKCDSCTPACGLITASIRGHDRHKLVLNKYIIELLPLHGYHRLFYRHSLINTASSSYKSQC